MTSVPQLLGLALQHYRQGEWPQAEQLYRRVLQADPNQTEALRILALVACQTGRGAMAIDYLRAVLKLRPRWADAHNDLGMVLISQRRFAEAALSFQEAVLLRPDLAAAHNNLGNTLRKLGRAPEAAASLQEAIRLVPRYAEAHYNLGLVIAAQGKPNESLEGLRQAVHLKPDYAEAHMQIGRTLARLNQHAEAAASFKEVLRLQPENAEALAELALAGSEQIAVSQANSPRASRPAANDSKVPVESVADAIDSPEAAGCGGQVSHDRAVLAEVPDDGGMHIVSSKHLEDAEMSWEQTLHLVSDYARLHFYLAHMLERQGRSESALPHYEEVMRLEPGHAETRIRIGTIRRISGDSEGALVPVPIREFPPLPCPLPPKRGKRRVERETPGVEPALDPATKAILVGQAHKIGNLPMTTESRADRHQAASIKEGYERWEQYQNHCESPPNHSQPVVARVGDSAALDVYFGLVADESAYATGYSSAEPALESMAQHGERGDQIQAGICSP
jgi:tetratricopeptide (TPR) repeat protein